MNFVPWTLNFVYFVDRAIHELKIPMKYLFTLVIAYHLKSMNSSGHKHVQCLTMKFRAHRIK